MVTFNYLPGKSLPGTCAHRDQQIIEHSFFQFKIAAQFQNSCLVFTLFVHNQQGRNTISKDNITTALVHFPNLVFHFIAIIAVAVIYIIIIIIIVSITKCLNMIGS